MLVAGSGSYLLSLYKTNPDGAPLATATDGHFSSSAEASESIRRKAQKVTRENGLARATLESIRVK
jgi:hypothetical protein